MSQHDDGGPTLRDFDATLHEVLRDLVDLGLPCRIYGWAFKGEEERNETEVANLISCMIDAAIWGAQNRDWVLAYERNKEAEESALDEDESEGSIH